ncbi:cytochrome c5 family protein [Marinimicrobium sp. ABcell2]|uniref:c-type cytochrome n=1 Tax=Marinimicrobium sp. ABcell2 TaxID=3069751 RepID=UPI0027B0B092|nr:c-type cytochrome [Marinimicrobium sp. ABcell2]MDQ2078386.1 c-type cytochrome [Marinimicrobium sp. ABcell2]
MRLFNKKVGLVVALCLGLISAAAVAQSDRVNEAIKSRLAPVGSVCMAGEPCASGEVADQTVGARDPEDIYNTSCATCHNAGVAGAPVLGDADQWNTLIQERGMEAIYNNAINGIGGMPAMGLCTTCSEEEMRATVDYMIEESQ